MNKGGTLIIPEGIKPIRFEDEEIGRQFVVLSTAYLYANPPSIVTQQIINDQNSEIEIFPTHLIEKKHNVMIGITGQVESGEIVLAREVPGDSTVMQVATFEKTGKAHDDMPETGEGIVIKNKGYVLRSQLRPDHSNAETFSKPLLNQFRSIFPNENLLGDVHQHKFGDCFLLASILAILNQEGGADYIKSMMIQKQGSTVVKLFDPNEKTFVYYEISNSYHQKSGQNSVLHKAPWVHILEKAYAAHAYKKNNQTEHDDRKFVPTFPAFSEVYGSGGHPDVALTILTGSPATEYRVKSAMNIPWGPDNLFYCMNVYNKLSPFINPFEKEEISQIDRLISQISEDKKALDFLLKYNTDISNDEEFNALSEKTKTILLELNRIIRPKLSAIKNEKDRQTFMESFSEYINAHLDLNKTQDIPIVSVLRNIWNMAQLGKYLLEVLPQEKLSDLVTSLTPDRELSQLDYASCTFERFQRLNPRPPEEIIRAFKQHYSPDGYIQRWDGKLGTGDYSDDSVALYAEICHHLSSPSNVIVASAKFQACPDSLGLRSQHAYAVVGASEKTINGKAIKFITIRNPWGHTGRLYDWDQHEVMPTESNSEQAATFDLELSDFTRYFYKYTVGQYEILPAVAINAKNNNDYISHGEIAVVGLVMAGAIGVALALTVSLICLPIIVGLSLLFGTLYVTAANAAEKAKSDIKSIDDELSAVKPTSSTIFRKSSTPKLIKKFEAQEEVVSRGGSPLSDSHKQIAGKENREPSKSKVVFPQRCAVEAERAFPVSDLQPLALCQ